MTQPTYRPTTWLIVGAIVAAVVAVAVIALVSGGGDDDVSATAATDGTSAPPDGAPDAGADPADTAATEPTPVPEPIGEFGTPSVSGTSLPPVPGAGDDPAVGAEAPTVEGTDFFGVPVSIAPGGDATLVVFLAHWCSHCNAEAPRLADAVAAGVPEGVRVVVVPTASQDGAPHWPPSRWVQEMGVAGLPTVVDDEAGTIARAFGLDSFPYMVLLDGQNRVVSRFLGEQPDGFFAQVFEAASGV